MAKLNAASRNALPSGEFAGPDRSYPIEDASHARNALSRVSANGSPSLKKEVSAKVHEKYPSIGAGALGKRKGPAKKQNDKKPKAPAGPALLGMRR